MGPVEALVRASLKPGQELRTPSGAGRFSIAEIGPDGILLLLGETKARTRFFWPALEGVPAFLRHRGWVEIGGKYLVSAKVGTFDEYFKQFVNRVTAGWMAVVLETAGVLDVDRTRPAHVRLKKGM